jgi:plasmid stabilization system protein ParE
MAASYRVIVGPQALQDLDEILRYISQQSPQNSAKMIDRLRKAAQSLDLFPNRY